MNKTKKNQRAQRSANHDNNDDDDVQPTRLPSAGLWRVGEEVDAAATGRGSGGGEDGGGVGEVAVGGGAAGVVGVLHHSAPVRVRQLIAGWWASGTQ